LRESGGSFVSREFAKCQPQSRNQQIDLFIKIIFGHRTLSGFYKQEQAFAAQWLSKA
jgi:hypothetical protein